MTDLPPLMRERRADADHLRLLAIFHFIVASLAMVGVGFLFLHYSVMHMFMADPGMWKNQKGGPPPAQLFALFKWFYAAFGLFLAAGGVANLLSGLFIRKRRHRMFSLIVAGLNCIQVPFGTLLGVFTLIVLLRESVRDVYDVQRSVEAA